MNHFDCDAGQDFPYFSLKSSVHIWVIKHHISPALRYYHSANKANKHACNKVAARKNTIYIREVILRKYCHCFKRGGLGIKLSQQGKPYCTGVASKALKFSISHSWMLSVLAVTREVEVGIDIEHINPYSLLVPDPPYRSSINSKHCQPLDNLKSWVEMEATNKMYGRGINNQSYSPSHIEERPNILTWIMNDSYLVSVATQKPKKIQLFTT